jgi:hypothetical protein
VAHQIWTRALALSHKWRYIEGGIDTKRRIAALISLSLSLPTLLIGVLSPI